MTALMKGRTAISLFQYLFILLCTVGYALPAGAQQVQVKADEKKLYNERAESVIKNFFSSLETYRELKMSSEILLEIQRNCLWKGSGNTARFFEDFTQAGHGKAYKQSNVRDYLRNYCYTFSENQDVYVTVQDFKFDNLFREGDHYYMKVRFTRLLEHGDKVYRYPLEAVCNFTPGINNINNGGLQSVDKLNSDYVAENTKTGTTSPKSNTPRPATPRPATPRPAGQGNVAGSGAGKSAIKMNQEEIRLFEQGKTYYSERQYAKAEQCFRQLSSYPEVYFYLGYIYSYPKETQNTALGFFYTSKAAGAGITAAQNNLGQMYEEGIHVRKDLRKAYEWYLEAARKENPKAMYNIGRFCYEGIYVKQDFDTAFKWYLASYNKSADGTTATRIGECLYYGRGCKPDYGKAVEFLEYARSKGKGNDRLLEQARQKKNAQPAGSNSSHSGSTNSSNNSAGSNYLRAYEKAKEGGTSKTATLYRTSRSTTGLKVEGTVKDKKGEPIIGASVLVKGTSIGVVTDLDGKFSLTAPDSDSILQFDFIGYKRVEVKAAPKVTVVMK